MNAAYAVVYGFAPPGFVFLPRNNYEYTHDL